MACGLGDGAPGAQLCDDLAEAGARDLENRGESAPDRGKHVLSAELLKGSPNAPPVVAEWTRSSLTETRCFSVVDP
jgi:hypothetical protein